MKRLHRWVIVIILLISIFGYGYYWAFYDIQRIKGVEVLTAVSSPDGQYTATAYLTNGGATTSFGVIGEISDNTTGKEWNVYWQYRCSEADIVWLDNDTIMINDVQLNIHHDRYDYRHQ